ncbi:hypothetical protein ACU686_18695 [Yinghuangia aomiensis]
MTNSACGSPSTARPPGYAKVFETHGWDDLQPRLNRLFAAKDTTGMAAAITDDVLDALTVSAPRDSLATALADRLPRPRRPPDLLLRGQHLDRDPETIARWSTVAADWRKLG